MVPIFEKVRIRDYTRKASTVPNLGGRTLTVQQEVER